jgi:hypothetical protein
MMNNRVSLNGTVAADEKPDLGAQIAAYVTQQPENVQVWHRRMKWLHVAGVVLIGAAFIAAVYVSAALTKAEGTTIAAAWLALLVSIMTNLLLYGLHVVILRASPPIALFGENQAFKTGSKAVSQGWGIMFVAVIGTTFWGLVIYVIWSGRLSGDDVFKAMDFLNPVIGAGVAIAVLVALYRQFIRSQ